MRRRLLGFALLLAAVAGIQTGRAEESSAANASRPVVSATMKNYVLLFRQSARPLTEAEQKRRADEVRAWALRQIELGRKLDPRILADPRTQFAAGGATVAPTETPLIAIVFFVAADEAGARAIAASHPGLNYGVTVELRAWDAPPGAARAAAANASNP